MTTLQTMPQKLRNMMDCKFTGLFLCKCFQGKSSEILYKLNHLCFITVINGIICKTYDITWILIILFNILVFPPNYTPLMCLMRCVLLCTCNLFCKLERGRTEDKIPYKSTVKIQP